MILFLGIFGASYLLGAIPTGLLVGRLKGIDVRKQGSGNIGATNVARVVGKLPGLFVLLVDAAKGWLPVAVLAPLAVSSQGRVSPELVKVLLGVAAVAGHIWNPFLQFKGGRGVATSLGVLLGLDLRVGLAVLGVWLAVVWWTRYVSVGSVAAALAAPFLMMWMGLPTVGILGGIGISLAIIARHRPNILRLLHGEENRVGQKREVKG